MRTIPRPGATIEAHLDIMMEGLLIALLVFTPLAFGTVQTWAVCLMQAGLAVLAGLWICRLIWSRPASRPARVTGGADPCLTLAGYRFVRTGLAIPIAAFVALVALQLVPLPPAAVRAISPAAAAAFDRTLPGYADGDRVEFSRLEEALLPGEEARVVPALLDPHGEIPIPEDLVFASTRPISLYPFATWGRLILLLSLLAAFLVSAHGLQSPARQERVCWVVALTGFAISVVGILQALQWNGRVYWLYPAPDDASPFGPFFNHNHFAAYLEMSIPLALALFVIHVRRGREAASPLVLSGFAGVVMLAALVLAGSRGAVLSLGAAAVAYGGVMAARRQLGRLEWTVAAVAVGAALAFSIWIGAGRVAEMAEKLQSVVEVDQEPSLAARLVAWTHTLRIVADYPIAGAGLGTFTEAWIHYYPPGTANVWKEAHNDYLQIAAETGVSGLALLGIGMTLFLRRHLFRSPQGGDRPPTGGVSIHHAVAIGVLSILFHEAVDFSLQVPAISLLFVVLSGMLVAGTARRAEA